MDERPRPMRFIAARHDLTFPADLSREVIARVGGWASRSTPVAPLRPLHYRRAPVGLPRRLEDRHVPPKAPLRAAGSRQRAQQSSKKKSRILKSEF